MRRAAEHHLVRDARKIRQIHAGAPHPDPEGCTTAAVKRDLRGAEWARLADIRRNAEEAAWHAAELRQRAGLHAVLPWTAAARELRLADHAAELARRRLDGAEAAIGGDLWAAADHAPDEAAARQRQQREWDERPDVQDARERERLNRMAAAAIRSGDPEITALAAASDLDAARAEVRRREEAAGHERQGHRCGEELRYWGALECLHAPRECVEPRKKP